MAGPDEVLAPGKRRFNCDFLKLQFVFGIGIQNFQSSQQDSISFLGGD